MFLYLHNNNDLRVSNVRFGILTDIMNVKRTNNAVFPNMENINFNTFDYLSIKNGAKSTDGSTSAIMVYLRL